MGAQFDFQRFDPGIEITKLPLQVPFHGLDFLQLPFDMFSLLSVC
jgi:hypothetical protein